MEERIISLLEEQNMLLKNILENVKKHDNMNKVEKEWWMSEKQIAWAESYAQKLFYSLSEDGDWSHWVWCTRRLRNVWDEKVPQSFMPFVASRLIEMIGDKWDLEKFDFN